MRKKKLYKATLNMDVLFLAVAEPGPQLDKLAKEFLKEELSNRVPGRINVVNVDSMSQVPEDWRDNLLWGTDDDITARGYFSEIDSEYKEYLRLKEKFEGSSDE